MALRGPGWPTGQRDAARAKRGVRRRSRGRKEKILTAGPAGQRDEEEKVTRGWEGRLTRGAQLAGGRGAGESSAWAEGEGELGRASACCGAALSRLSDTRAS